MIKNIITYIIWLFISSLFLKSGIEMIIDKRISIASVLLIIFSIHLSVVLPVLSAIGRSTNENS